MENLVFDIAVLCGIIGVLSADLHTFTSPPPPKTRRSISYPILQPLKCTLSQVFAAAALRRSLLLKRPERRFAYGRRENASPISLELNILLEYIVKFKLKIKRV